MYLEANHLIII